LRIEHFQFAIGVHIFLFLFLILFLSAFWSANPRPRPLDFVASYLAHLPGAPELLLVLNIAEKERQFFFPAA